MHDIKIPDPSGKKPVFGITQVTADEAKAPEPGEKVKVKFKNFVELVATHNFEGVMNEHSTEDIILSTNLLTDLANAHEEVPDQSKRMLPIILIVGIIIGVLVTYLLIRL